MWNAKKDYAEENRFKHYAKKHPREVASCFANLNRAIELLDGGMTLDQLATMRFFSSEGGGLFRIGQTGIQHAHETRLYVYVTIVQEEMQILTIGDKSTQQQDINRCKDAIKDIAKKKGQGQ